MATVIKPSEGGWRINLRELWAFREVFYFLVWRDIKIRYKQTVLGAAWALIQPAVMMVIFTVVFSRMVQIPDVGMPYPLYVYSGLVAWTFFSTAINSASNSVVSSERLITKVYFARLSIPLAAVSAAVVDFVISLSLLALMMAWYGVAPGAELILLPALILAMALAASGVGAFLAALNVSYRDFRYVTPFLVQVWMWGTPMVYAKPNSEGSGLLQAVLFINPMNGLVSAFRSSIVGGPVSWVDLATGGVGAVLMFLVGCCYFRRVEDTFADVI